MRKSYKKMLKDVKRKYYLEGQIWEDPCDNRNGEFIMQIQKYDNTNMTKDDWKIIKKVYWRYKISGKLPKPKMISKCYKEWIDINSNNLYFGDKRKHMIIRKRGRRSVDIWSGRYCTSPYSRYFPLSINYDDGNNNHKWNWSISYNDLYNSNILEYIENLYYYEYDEEDEG